MKKVLLVFALLGFSVGLLAQKSTYWQQRAEYQMMLEALEK